MGHLYRGAVKVSLHLADTVNGTETHTIRAHKPPVCAISHPQINQEFLFFAMTTPNQPYPNPYAGAYGRQQAKEYKRQQIETASQEEILILLYEGAIKFLLLAKKAHEPGREKPDLQAYHNNLIKAQAIIMEFMNSLDIEIGGETAKQLYALYEYLHYRLVQANIKKDVTMIDEVVGHLRGLKATWEEAIKINIREKMASGQLQDHQLIDVEENANSSRHSRSA